MTSCINFSSELDTSEVKSCSHLFPFLLSNVPSFLSFLLTTQYLTSIFISARTIQTFTSLRNSTACKFINREKRKRKKIFCVIAFCDSVSENKICHLGEDKLCAFYYYQRTWKKMKKPCVVKNIFIILVVIIGLTLLVVLLVNVVVLGEGLLVLLVLGHQVVEV